MFRGAIILGIGFTLGYSKALSDSQELKDLLLQAIVALHELADEVAKEEAAKKEAAEEPSPVVPTDAVDSSAVEVSPDTPPTQGE